MIIPGTMYRSHGWGNLHTTFWLISRDKNGEPTYSTNYIHRNVQFLALTSSMMTPVVWNDRKLNFNIFYALCGGEVLLLCHGTDDVTFDPITDVINVAR